MFVVWEHHLEKAATGPDKPKSFWTPPPLLKLSIFARAKGRMAVILAIAFLNWSGFISWTFWAQVCPRSPREIAEMLKCARSAVLPELPRTNARAHDAPLYPHVCHGMSV